MWNLTKLSKLLDKLADNTLSPSEETELIKLWNFFFGGSVGAIHAPSEIFALVTEEA